MDNLTKDVEYGAARQEETRKTSEMMHGCGDRELRED